jgi:hypothetical protein
MVCTLLPLGTGFVSVVRFLSHSRQAKDRRRAPPKSSQKNLKKNFATARQAASD